MEIPGYTIIRELGRGGMATVYLARQDRLGRHVALKVMTPPSPASEDFASRFIKEGRIIAQLQHPAIITIYDFDILGALHYFSMEYLPNGALSDAITEGMTEAKALSITRGIAQALTVAHDNGVIHRDIKPQNILFRTDGTPVLTDFGIARAAGAGLEQTQLTSVGMVIGSPRYMSPEQTMGKPVDARSDLYSLGVVLYEMLTQELPYQAEDVFSLAMKHCSAPIPELPSALARFQPLIEKLLAKNPQDRLGSATELIRELDAYQGGQTQVPITEDNDSTRIVAAEVSSSLAAATKSRTSAEFPRPTGTSAQPRPLLRRPLFYLPVGILLLAAAGGFGWHVWQNMAFPYSALLAQLPTADKGRSGQITEMERRAIGFLREGNHRQSLRAVNAALQFAPDDPRILALRDLVLKIKAAHDLLKKSETAWQQGLYDDGLALARRGLELLPEQKALSRIAGQLEQSIAARAARQAGNFLRQAQDALEQESFAESLRFIEDGLAAFPDDRALTTLKGEVEQRIATIENLKSLIDEATKLATEGLNEQSLAIIDKALQLDPRDSRLLDLRDTVARQLERDNRQRAENLVARARDLAGRGNFAQALPLLDEAIDATPERTEREALEQTRAAMLTDQQSARVASLLDQARAALREQDLRRALALISEAEGLQPENDEIIPLRSIIVQRELTDRQSQLGDSARQIGQCDQLLVAERPTHRLAAHFANLAAAVDCYAEAFPAAEQQPALIAKLSAIEEELKTHLHRESAIAEIQSAIAVARKLATFVPEVPGFQSLARTIARQSALLPDMIALPGDCFMIGATADAPQEADEVPRRACVEPFSLGTHEVTYREFKRFVEATNYQTDAERGTGGVPGCFSFDPNAQDPWTYHPWSSWRQPIKTLATEPDHPVACVSQQDARNYSIWLSNLLGEHLRLPTEAEWEYAARAGTNAPTYWDHTTPQAACDHANVADTGSDWNDGFACNDRYEWMAPVGRFKPNDWGLYDMLGNVAEWTCSEYEKPYGGAETRCAESDSREPVVLRGGAWNTGPPALTTSFRNRNFPESRYSFIGFRLAGEK